jgi:hypothetical protein
LRAVERGARGVLRRAGTFEGAEPLFLDDPAHSVEEAEDNSTAASNSNCTSVRLEIPGFRPRAGSGFSSLPHYKEMRAIGSGSIFRRTASQVARTNDRSHRFQRSIEDTFDFPRRSHVVALIIAEYQCDVLVTEAKKRLLSSCQTRRTLVTYGNALISA